jgi:hypothetical protein
MTIGCTLKDMYFPIARISVRIMTWNTKEIPNPDVVGAIFMLTHFIEF